MSEKKCYVDPLSPFGFRHLFGQESRKEILLEFLNVLFEGENRILKAVVSAPGTDDVKDALLSLVCTDKDGDQFTLEFQHLEEHNFREKNKRFMARHFSNSEEKRKAGPGFPYKDNYLVGFLDSRLSEKTKFLHFRDVFHMQKSQEESHQGILGFKFMEIPGFDDPEEEFEDELEKWLYVFRHMSHLDHRPEALDSPVFENLFKLAETAGLTPAQRLEYEQSLKNDPGDRDDPASESRQEAKESAKRTIDFETRLGDFPFGILIKVRSLTPEEAERYKSRK